MDVSELLNGEEDSIKNVIEYEEERKNIKNNKACVISIIIYIVFNIILSILIIISNWNLYTFYYDKLSDKVRMKKNYLWNNTGNLYNYGFKYNDIC